MWNRILVVILISLHISTLPVLSRGILYRRDAAHFKGRILYGQDADPSDFLFITRLEIGEMLCSGTIIADQWILSSAHCFDQGECETTKIFPSVWMSNSTSIADPLECYIHEKFDGVKHRNDLVLIKTSEDLIQDGLSAIVPLPEPGTSFPEGTSATILGWGMTEDAIFPEHLIQGDTEIQNWETCNSKQKHYLGECDSSLRCSGQNLSVKIICTQAKAPLSASSCVGDSGSPVIAEGVLAGITSYTLTDDNLCLAEAPSMHMNIVDYLPWIYSFIDPDRDTSQMEVLEDPEE